MSRMSPAPVEVWWTHVRPESAALVELLSGEEHTRFRTYRVSGARERYLTGRALVRVLLGRRIGVQPAAVPLRSTCTGCGGPHGRPRLVLPAGPPAAVPHVSVSHSGDLVAVAVSVDVSVGIDVQQVDAALDLGALATVALTDREARALDLLATGDRAEAFARLWARKEAVLKALGTGLSRPLRDLDVSTPDRPPAVVRWPEDRPPESVTMRDLDPGHGYRCTVAVVAPTMQVTEHDAGPLLTAVEAGER